MLNVNKHFMFIYSSSVKNKNKKTISGLVINSGDVDMRGNSDSDVPKSKPKITVGGQR